MSNNGTRIVFKGFRSDPDAIKSLEGCDICWVEEAQSISQKSLDMLIPANRREGSEIWFSWNERAKVPPVGER